MFGAMAETEKLNGNGTSPEGDSRVFLPGKRDDKKDDDGQHPYRVTIPRNNNYFNKYPRKWTWDSWAKRVEFEWIMIARALDAVVWATIGALVGLALLAIPGAFIGTYQYAVWQPLGAAIGASLGTIAVWRRWIPVMQSHDEML